VNVCVCLVSLSLSPLERSRPCGLLGIYIYVCVCFCGWFFLLSFLPFFDFFNRLKDRIEKEKADRDRLVAEYVLWS
jgi:hypothetical protein